MDESKTFAVTELETLLAVAFADALMAPGDPLPAHAAQFLSAVIAQAREANPNVTHVNLAFLPDDITDAMRVSITEAAEASLGRN